jgi:thiol-disulfide isomerase/thioredoxin
VIRKFAVSALALMSSLMITTLAHAAKLGVGDKAPAIKVAKWLKGTPVASFQKGKVYVVEFWATWCPPCIESIPHLTDLAKKYKGKATFVGVSVSEAEPGAKLTSYEPKVSAFVKKMGAKMNYNVAVDGPQATMSRTWMDAAAQNGIPTAFVVNQQGNIAWIGHPMGELDEVVGKVIAGKFDSKAIKAMSDKKAEAERKQRKMRELFSRVASLAQQEKNQEAIDELERIIKEYPEFGESAAMMRYSLMLKTDESAAYAYAKELADKEPFSKSAQVLNTLAWMMVDDKAPLKSPDYELAVSIAERAVEVSKGEDPMVLDTLGYAYFKKGDLDKALEVQEKAIKMLDVKGGYPEDAVKEIRERYEMMKKKKG